MMMIIINLLTCSLGIVLLSILLHRIRQVNTHLRLKKYHAKEAGLADLLNYASMVDDGIILGKNGSLMTAWLYAGDDNVNTTDEQRNLNALRINQAFTRMGSGWMVHIDAVRKASPHYSARDLSHFPDAISAAIDEERRKFFEQMGTLYEGFFVLTLTWFPPLLAQRQFVELMFDDDTQSASQSQSTQLIELFKRECLNLESRLSSSLSLERLNSIRMVHEDGSQANHDSLLRWLQYCITGLNHPVILPDHPVYLDALIGGQELWTGTIPKIGRHFIQCVSIEGFPLESSPGMLSALGELTVDYRWSSRFIFMDNHEALSHLERYQKKWKQKIRGFFDQLFKNGQGTINQDALEMVQDISHAAKDINSGMVAEGYYSSVVVLMSDNRDQIEVSARMVETLINALGFTARVETINTMEAFLGTLPGHGVENVRRPLVNTMNFSCFLPTSTVWTGENKAPSPLFSPLSPALMQCVTQGNSPFRFNLHVRDLGHTIMFGPTRAGKSTHLAMIALQWRRYAGARIYAFDKGLSMFPTCKAVGGDHYTIGAQNDALAFAPLQYLDTKADRAWAMEWIDAILALNGIQTTAKQRNEIGYAIISMHQSDSRTISDFTMLIQDESIRDALKQYTIDGLMGHLVDAEKDGLGLSDFMTFEIEQLMGLGEKFALPVLLYLFRRIEASLDGRPTLIILDEAWLMLAHAVFRLKIAEWLDSMAKKNCTVLMATQHLSHAVNSGILDVIVESTATKIFLPNIYARDEETAAVYRRMGLNNRQIEIVATAVPKRDYYYVSEKGSRLYSLAMQPLALAFAGATDKESIATIQQLEVHYGSNWPERWLKSKGLHQALEVAA